MNHRLSGYCGTIFTFLALTGCVTPTPSSYSHQTSATTFPRVPQNAVAVDHAPLNYDAALATLPSIDTAAPLIQAQPINAADISEFRQSGRASWYGKGFHGRRTANGERFNMHALTAAHRTLPLASYIRVTNQVSGKSVVVKINDRGPFIRGRVLDLSYAAAKMIGVARAGTARVKIQGLSPQEARIARDEQLASATK